MGAKHLRVLFHLPHILVCINLAAAAPNWRCNETAGNFTPNSMYSRNRDLIASSLPSNAAINSLFYNTSIGEGSSRVFALVGCTGDSSTQNCSNCVTTAINDLAKECPNQKEAVSWGAEGEDTSCLIRFADHSFFGTLQLLPVDVGYTDDDDDDDNTTSNSTNFDVVWGNLTDSVLRKASSSGSKFMTGGAQVSASKGLYALMYCTQDISGSDCRRCLRSSVEYFQTCCHGHSAGYVNRPNCIFQWDLYPASNVVADAPTAAPPPPPSANTTDAVSPSSTLHQQGNKGSSSRTVIVTIVAIVVTLIAISVFGCTFLRRRWKPKKEETEIHEEIESGEALRLEFRRIREATNDFSEDNKLGKGGFGVVYKGRLPNGQDVAVKRLSKHTNQGRKEFENEVQFLAKLQHRNLVRLLGFCMQGVERLLVYEYLPLSSLEKYISDPTKSLLLDWDKRYKIITGIARGTLYLHEDSQVRIIHRDLKPSNILLDADMNAKISDFGMAKLFPMDITQANASRLVGTLGYMAPEYVQNGQVSVKTDVYSFGVLVLEIISGQRINCFSGKGEKYGSLLSYAWENWKKGTLQNFLDPNLRGSPPESEVMRCIHLALLCVQENAANRPSMATVVLMLSSSISVPLPSRPAFMVHVPMSPERSVPTASYGAQVTKLAQPDNENIQFSYNEASLSEIAPRSLCRLFSPERCGSSVLTGQFCSRMVGALLLTFCLAVQFTGRALECAFFIGTTVLAGWPYPWRHLQPGYSRLRLPTALGRLSSSLFL